MTNPITINGLPTTTTAAAGDFVPIWRASNGDTRKITKSNFMGATFTGGGSIATGGFTLTMPATGTAALKTGTPTAGRVASWSDANTVQDAGFAASDVARLATAQTFTALKTFGAGADVTKLDVTAPDINTSAVVARGVASQVAPVLAVTGGTVAFGGTSGWAEIDQIGTSSGVTRNIDVTCATVGNQPVIVHIDIAMSTGGSSNRRVLYSATVAFSTHPTGGNATIRQTTVHINNTDSVTLVAPAAITDGFRITVTPSGGNLSSARSCVRVWTTTSGATVTLGTSV